VPQVDVGRAIVEAGQPADRLHEPSARREGTRSEEGAGSIAHHAPVLDALGLVELARADPVGHAENLPVSAFHGLVDRPQFATASVRGPYVPGVRDLMPAAPTSKPARR
jgi:hypothetical protein